MTGKQAATQIAAGRIALGVAVLAGKPFEALFRVDDSQPTARFLARLAGVRDIALGMFTLWALRDGDGPAARRAVLAGAACDAADMVSALRGDGMPGLARWTSMVSAAGAAAAGGWAAREIRV